MMSRILRFFASDVVAKGLAVLFIPFFSYLLGPTELGLFSEWFSFFNVFAAVVALGIPSYVLVLMSRDRDDYDLINQRVLRFFAEWCLVIGSLNLVIWYLSPNWLYGIGLFLAAVFFTVISYASAILRHLNSFGRYFTLQLLLACATSLLPLILVIYSATWEARSSGYLLGLCLLAVAIYLFYGTRIKLASITGPFRVEALGFGASIALMAGFAWLKLGADIQILKFASGYSSSGILFFAFQIVSIVSIIAASLNRSSAPVFYQLLNDSNLRDFKMLIVRLIAGLTGLALLTVAIAHVLVGFFLQEFEGAMLLIYPMVLGAIIYGASQFVASVYLYCKKPILLTWCIGVSSIVHPVSSYLLVTQMGWHWIGGSYLISSILFMLLVILNLKKVNNLWAAEV